jgi:NADP-dependent 3-hydroxy acid dehydrogenase YdfG
VCAAFASAGAKVALIARNEEALDVAAREAREAGTEALALPLDVANSEALEEAAARVQDTWGRIDTWINAAMVSVFSPALEMTMDEFRRITEVNYLGSVYGTLSALRRMRQQDEGAIIQICSALAYRSIPLQSAYCATKAAMRAFSDSVRSELIHDGSKVRISVLILPAVNRPQFNVVRTRLPRHPKPVPPIYQPELIAEAAVYAAEHSVREMTIGGGALKAVIGQKFIPGPLDHYVAATCYEGQQTDQPVEPNRPDNLYSPLPGDPGCHGAFDARSRATSLQLWLRTHGAALATAAGAATLTVLASRWRSGMQPAMSRDSSQPLPRVWEAVRGRVFV